MEHDQYCREVEAHLRRKNDGHLIRIVGPSFELVCGWAARGIPLKIVQHGIDRYFERYYAKGPRRRPVRIDFCEADVLDAFDAWRRAVGTYLLPPTPDDAGPPARTRPRHSLAAHLDRVVGRLAARRTDPSMEALGAAVDRVLGRLDALRDTAVKARGPARTAVVEELAALDRELSAAARTDSDAMTLEALAEEAAADLESFRDRMTREVYQRALDAAVERLLREGLGLPRIAYE